MADIREDGVIGLDFLIDIIIHLELKQVLG